MAFAYIFIVGFDEDGPHTDSFMDVSAALDQTAETYQRAVATAKRLGIDSTQLEQLTNNMSGISLRARITGRRLHKVLTEEPITREDIDALMRRKQAEQTLKTFLQESEI
jgi:site-specific recombinase XerD